MFMERYVCVTEQLDGNQMMGRGIMHCVESFFISVFNLLKAVVQIFARRNGVLVISSREYIRVVGGSNNPV